MDENSQQKGAQQEELKLSGRVLVAEDAVSNQLLIKILLNKLGFHVTMAENGQRAVEEVTQQSFDMIFMDIQMPEMDGYEATRLIRKKGITTPIIAVTANTSRGERENCLQAGCNDYVPKPICNEILIKAIRKHLPLDDPKINIEHMQKLLNQPCRNISDSETSPETTENSE
ncbi:MAG: response regulator [Sedimentisphaerales bacterium]|nr:response regulator [Sedimentisphaerales bacterium]